MLLLLILVLVLVLVLLMLREVVIEIVEVGIKLVVCIHGGSTVKARALVTLHALSLVPLVADTRRIYVDASVPIPVIHSTPKIAQLESPDGVKSHER